MSMHFRIGNSLHTGEDHIGVAILYHGSGNLGAHILDADNLDFGRLGSDIHVDDTPGFVGAHGGGSDDARVGAQHDAHIAHALAVDGIRCDIAAEDNNHTLSGLSIQKKRHFLYLP